MKTMDQSRSLGTWRGQYAEAGSIVVVFDDGQTPSQPHSDKQCHCYIIGACGMAAYNLERNSVSSVVTAHRLLSSLRRGLVKTVWYFEVRGSTHFCFKFVPWLYQGFLQQKIWRQHEGWKKKTNPVSNSEQQWLFAILERNGTRTEPNHQPKSILGSAEQECLSTQQEMCTNQLTKSCQLASQQETIIKSFRDPIRFPRRYEPNILGIKVRVKQCGKSCCGILPDTLWTHYARKGVLACAGEFLLHIGQLFLQFSLRSNVRGDLCLRIFRWPQDALLQPPPLFLFLEQRFLCEATPDKSITAWRELVSTTIAITTMTMIDQCYCRSLSLSSSIMESTTITEDNDDDNDKDRQ